MRKTTLFCLVSMTVLLASCYNSAMEDVLNIDTNTQTGNVESEISNSYCFFYEGQKYESSYQQIDSTTIVFSDSGVNEMWNTLKDKPNLATLIHDNGDIEYFDNDSIRRKAQVNPRPQTRIVYDQWYSVTQAYLEYWKELDFKGKSWNHTLNDQNGWSAAVSSFIGTGLNDRISSYKLITSYVTTNYPTRNQSIVVTFYEDTNYLGYSLTVALNWPRTEAIRASLRTVYMPSGKNWNDEISSLKFERIMR